MSEKKPKYVPVEDLRAIVDAFGAIVMSICRELTPEQREGVAANLLRISQEAEAAGNRRSAHLISELTLAAESQWRRPPAPPDAA